MPRDGEQQFMAEVREMLRLHDPKAIEREMESWGGWYRNRFREKPDKCRRVLADIRSLVRERRIRLSPGRAFRDLWKRLP